MPFSTHRTRFRRYRPQTRRPAKTRTTRSLSRYDPSPRDIERFQLELKACLGRGEIVTFDLEKRAWTKWHMYMRAPHLQGNVTDPESSPAKHLEEDRVKAPGSHSSPRAPLCPHILNPRRSEEDCTMSIHSIAKGGQEVLLQVPARYHACPFSGISTCFCMIYRYQIESIYSYTIPSQAGGILSQRARSTPW